MSTSKPAPRESERFIVLLRHGIAEDQTPEKDDADRALTTEGHLRMKEIARGLERIFSKAQVIYSSPLVRAMQTAKRVAKAYRDRVKIETTDALLPGASTKDLLALIAKSKARHLIFVGHEPNLTNNLRALTGLGKSARLDLKKGGCYGVRLQADGKGVLEWVLPPKALRK